jgi:hypothetical protein
MALLKSRFIAEPVKGGTPPGTHKPPLLGNMICGFIRSFSVLVCSDGASFLLFTNSKNSATC